MASFSAVKFAKRWISEKHHRTDDPTRVIEMGTKLRWEDTETDEFGQNELIRGSALFKIDII